MGLGTLVLAIIGVVRWRDRELTARWLTLVVVSTVFAAGRKLGLYSIAFAVLPGMDRFRVPSRSLFLASLGAAVLAGAGVHELMSQRLTDSEWRALRLRLSGGLVVLAIVIGWVGSGRWLAENDGRESSREVSASHSIAASGLFWAAVAGAFVVVGIGGGRRRGQLVAAWGPGGRSP